MDRLQYTENNSSNNCINGREKEKKEQILNALLTIIRWRMDNRYSHLLLLF